MGPVAIAYVALAATAAATVYSAVQQKKAANAQIKAQKEASAVSTAQQRAQDLAARRQSLREERIRRAQIMQASEAQGTSGSSGELGSVASLGTQLGTNMSETSRNRVAAEGISKTLLQGQIEATSYNNRAMIGQAAGSIFSSIGSIAAAKASK